MFGVAAASLMLCATLYNLKDFGTTTPIRPTSEAFIVEVVFSMLVMLTKTTMSSDPRLVKANLFFFPFLLCKTIVVISDILY